MKLNHNPALYPYMLDPGFVQLINSVLEANHVDDESGVVLSFRDPKNKLNGNIHTVELAIARNGELMYLKTFTNLGTHPHSDMCKDLYFDFSRGIFQQCGQLLEIVVSQGLYTLIVRNLVANHTEGKYEVTVSPL